MYKIIVNSSFHHSVLRNTTCHFTRHASENVVGSVLSKASLSHIKLISWISFNFSMILYIYDMLLSTIVHVRIKYKTQMSHFVHPLSLTPCPVLSHSAICSPRLAHPANHMRAMVAKAWEVKTVETDLLAQVSDENGRQIGAQEITTVTISAVLDQV